LRSFCDFHEDYISRNIQLADAKAGLALVAFSGAVVLLLRDERFRSSVTSSLLDVWPFVGAFSAEATLAWLALAMSAAATVLAFWSIKPRLWHQSSRAPLSYTFWGDVAKYPRPGSKGSYAEVILALPPGALLEDRLDHEYELSRICAAKMSQLNRSMTCGASGAVLVFLWLVSHPAK